MIDPIETYITAMITVTAIITAAALLRSHYGGRRRHRAEVLAERYISILNRRLLEGGSPSRFPQIGRRRSRIVLAKVIAEIEAATYGYDRSVTSEIVRRYALDRLILNRAMMSTGMRRAQWLHTLALLDCDQTVFSKMTARFSRSRNRYVSLCTILAALNHTPERCIDILAECDRKLSPLDISEILMMLKRGLIPVAYQPMIQSKHRNVQLLGLCIVRHFGIVESEEYIARAAASEDEWVRSAALFTLCSLRLTLDRPEVRHAAAAMGISERRIWYRHLAADGYSLRALEHILSDSDRSTMHEWIEETVGSYKRCLTPTP